MAQRGRKINNVIDFPVNALSGAIRFHISDIIDWPPQPLKERMPNITEKLHFE